MTSVTSQVLSAYGIDNQESEEEALLHSQFLHDLDFLAQSEHPNRDLLDGAEFFYEDGELTHYGIKGMKWGVRRPVGPDGLVGSGSRRVRSEDSTAVRRIKKKRIHELSNQELQKINTRLELERKNRDLQNRGTLNKIKKGTAAAAVVLAVPTTIATAYNFYNSPAGQAMRNTIQKIWNVAKEELTS